MKQYLALARVSSREQEREGFSLEVQETAIERYAADNQGKITKLFRIAETATKPDERRAFKELLAYAKKNADELDAVLFFKVDRAARNLFDYVELERLEADYDLKVVYITQPTENTPAGRMMRRTLANMASFYTDQQSLDVKDGLRRRVESGLFMGKAPYGYRNIRIEGRGLIETDELKARNVRRLFDLYAYQGHTLDSLIDQLENEGIVYTEKVRRFTRSKLHTMLRDRAYIGEVAYQGQWYPGVQNPIIDRTTFDRVGQLLGGQVYRSHELTYAGNLIKCGQCGRSITGETITKKNGKTYRYYRCVGYTAKGHKRIRLNGAKLDEQMLSLLDKLRVEDEKVRHWFARVLRERTQDKQRESHQQVTELNRQLTLVRHQQDQLLNLRLLEEINQETFASKGTELRDRLAKLTLQIESQDRGRSEVGEIAVKAFELSQTLKQQWLTADYRAKRRLLEIVCLNFTLDDVTLVPYGESPSTYSPKGSILKTVGPTGIEPATF